LPLTTLYPCRKSMHFLTSQVKMGEEQFKKSN
jgi:hypothetical protein